MQAYREAQEARDLQPAVGVDDGLERRNAVHVGPPQRKRAQDQKQSVAEGEQRRERRAPRQVRDPQHTVDHSRRHTTSVTSYGIVGVVIYGVEDLFIYSICVCVRARARVCVYINIYTYN